MSRSALFEYSAAEEYLGMCDYSLHNVASRPAKVGDMLLVKDIIETGPDGAIGITFIDNTVFSAGPNSESWGT